MKDKNNKSKVSFAKKWWFWFLILLIVLVISGTIVFVILNQNVEQVSKDNTKLVKEINEGIKDVYSRSEVYSSADEKKLYIRLENFDSSSDSSKITDIFNVVKNNEEAIDKYENIIVSSYLTSSGEENCLYIEDTYTLPDFKKEKSLQYIDFDVYSDAVTSLTSTSSYSSTEKGEDITLSTGKYIVGEDVKAGKYDVIAKSGSGNFFVSGSTSVNEILATDKSYQEDYGWGNTYSNLTLKNGDEIELKNGLTVLLQAK